MRTKGHGSSRADMERRNAEAANRDKEATRRETRLILTMGEMIAVATLGILICWPASPV
ncbi:MAG: hypothetical protein OXC68_11015 [Aestuariivita sp.]|nr:hypothetical protein [Aestuariivita sp.]